MKTGYSVLLIIVTSVIASCSKKDTPAVNKPEVDVYTAVYTSMPNGSTVATIWKNGIMQIIGNSGSEAMSIAVRGNDVYAVGRSFTLLCKTMMYMLLGLLVLATNKLPLIGKTAY